MNNLSRILIFTLALTLNIIITAACGTTEEPSEPLFKLDKGEVLQVKNHSSDFSHVSRERL